MPFTLSSHAGAREFASSFDLKVYAAGKGGEPDRFLGFTSSRSERHVSVPSGEIWYVWPVGGLPGARLQRLVQEIKDQRIPGLDLSSHWEISDSSLVALETLENLEFLRLDQTRITNAGMEHLQFLKRLKALTLNNQIGDTGLAGLISLKRLEHLDVNHSKVTDRGLAALGALPRLRELNLSGTLITDAGVVSLAQAANLEYLDVSDTRVTDRALAVLPRFSHLRNLYLNPSVTDRGLFRLSALKKLRVLDLTGASITDNGMRALNSLTDLEELALSGTPVGDMGLREINRLRKLRVLELSGTRVTSDGVKWLGQMSRLETLSLSWDELTDAELVALGGLKNLKTVILNGQALPEGVLERVRSLAFMQSSPQKAGGSPEQAAVGAGHAPSAKPRPLTPMGETLKNAAAPIPAGAGLQGTSFGTDLVPAVPEKQNIATSPSMKGKHLEIEVSAAPRRRKATAAVSGLAGLKRIHEVEYEQAGGEPHLLPGEKPVIAIPRESAANSLGEIEVGAPTSHAR